MPEKPADKAKRRVKNPETFRERALKAAEDSAKPERAKKLRQTAARAAAPVVGPPTKAFRKIWGAKAFKPIRKFLRLLGKIVFVGYLVRSWRELRLVTWPGWSESRRLTFAVLVFAIIFGATVAGVDWFMDKAFKELFIK